MPQRIMPVGINFAGFNQITIGQQLRKRLISLNADGKHRHHIRPVGEESHAPEAFRLALGAIHAP